MITLWPVVLAAILGALLEWLRPWKHWHVDRLRWLHAAILYVAGVALVSIVIPMGHIGVAVVAHDKSWGALNVVDSVPDWAAVTLGVMLLDFTQWVCHWAFHHSPFLWRIHRLHHSDEVVDVSTAFRFHPLETLFRFLVQVAVIVVFGVPAMAVVISVILVIAFDVWEHTNATTPRLLQRLSHVIITPDVHRIHHSSDTRQQNGNLGTIFTLWDQIFGSYIPDRELYEVSHFGLGPRNRLSYSTLADLLFDPIRRS